MYRESLIAAAVLLVAAPAKAMESSDMLPFAVMGGTPTLDLRLRTEHADNDSLVQTEESTASTARLRLGFTTGKWNDLDLGVEYEGVSAVDKHDYNSTLNNQPTRPVVADPTGSELNQAWVRYAGIPKTTLQFGRERLAPDNQRFVGNVGWRQNEQTYDGVVVANKGLPGTELTYAYLSNINSIFFTDFPLKAHLANAAWSPHPAFKAVVYGYWLDFDDPNIGNRQDSATRGVRLSGAPALGESATLLYTAELARQDEHADAAALVDDDYLLGELGASVGATIVKLGYEVLGSSDGAYAVQTPLATLHAHDGWADLFLVTPARGLRDAYASAGTTWAGVTATVVYHEFSADSVSVDYGSELDVSLGYSFNRQLGLLAKYANYDATEPPATTFASNVDTDKGWVQLEYKF
jgi:hypothetical protein